MNAQHRQQSGPTDRTIGGRIDEERYDEWRSLPAMFFDQAERLGDRPLLISKQGGGWRDRSWGAVAAAIVQAAAGLKSLGVGHGDRVAIVSENRPEWLIADFATMMLGAITVPAYPTSTMADFRHLLADSRPVVAIVSTPALLNRFRPAAAETRSLRTIVTLHRPDAATAGAHCTVLEWGAVLEGGAIPEGTGPIENLAGLAARLRRDDPACIVYTSGTGGAPKGVMLSHGNILSNC